jgi:hypothetical protein
LASRLRYSVGYIALLCALFRALRETKITAQFLNI